MFIYRSDKKREACHCGLDPQTHTIKTMDVTSYVSLRALTRNLIRSKTNKPFINKLIIKQMKKFIFSAIAAIGLLLSPSCSDDNEALNSSGNEALVSFSVNLADGIQTKASIGDGTTAKKLFVRVFEDNSGSVGDEITGLAKKDLEMTNLQTDVAFELVKGKTYHFLFWAQAYTSGEAGSPYSFEGHTVKVSYNNAKANDEDRDAFYAVKTKTVTGSFQEDVELHRPFAQLNFLTTAEDIKAAINAGQRVDKTSIKISSAAQTLAPHSSFDPNEKPSVSDAAEGVLFGFADVPFTVSDDNTVSSPSSLWIKDNAVVDQGTANATQYFYLATTYFLVDNTSDATAQAVLANVNMKVKDAEGDGLSVQSVPVRMNYRTNIYGNLLTATGTFNVIIDKNFGGDNNKFYESVEVDNPLEIAEKIAEGATTIVASENFTLSTTEGTPTEIKVPQIFALDNDKELTFDFSAVATDNTVIKLSYNSSDTQKAPATVNVVATGTVEIDLEDSHVTLNGNEVNNRGTYTEVTASTSGTTLVVPDGVTVEKLIVKKGNVRIENGGKVTRIERHTEADENTPTYVTIVTGGVLTNTPDDEKIIITYEDATKGNVVLNGVYSFNTVKEAVAYAASKNISDVKLVLAAGEYQEAVSIPSNTTVSIEPASGLSANDVKFNGQLASLGNGVLNVKNITISHNPTIDLTGISQTGASAIALWGAAVVNCENVTFKNFANNATAITSWWSTGAGTQINVKNSTFNCGGQRPIRSDANVTVEDCTFNDPYRYAVQLTSKSSTMTAEYAVVNFKNNTIIAGPTANNPVYGIQLEGETYGCSHLIINGSGNTLDLGTTDKTGIMYYCECGKVQHAYIHWNVTDGTPNHASEQEVSSVGDFTNALTAAGRGEGDQTISITADLDFTGVEWTPVNVQGYTGTGVITINGNNHKITGLKDALFAGGFAGTSGIVINDLTIDGNNVTITDDTEEQGWGYFIKNIDSMRKITLKNCHLKNANITSTGGARVGGLIGWTSGYNNQNDGPVDTYVTIENCSVTNSKITAKGSVGAIIGHAGSNPATYQFIENCTVTGCTLHSTDDDDWRVGVVVGTANVGQVTISNITESSNTLSQDGKTAPEHSNLYGRFVPNATGKLTIDGAEITE